MVIVDSVSDNLIHQAATTASAVFCQHLDIWGRMSEVLWLYRQGPQLLVTVHPPADPTWTQVCALWEAVPHPVDPIASFGGRWPEQMVPEIVSVTNAPEVYHAFLLAVASSTWPATTPVRSERQRCYQEAVADPQRSNLWFTTAWNLPQPMGSWVRREIAPRSRGFVEFEMQSEDGQRFWQDVILRALGL